MRVADDRLDSPAAVPLVRALLWELNERYGAPDPDPDHLVAADLAPPTGAFVLAWDDGRPVGCGGVRQQAEGVGELKRMYVVPGHRGAGIGAAVLDALEQRSRELGYRRLVLETGVRQPEAIALYTGAGYEPIDPYGEYRDFPLSRCFARDLTG